MKTAIVLHGTPSKEEYLKYNGNWMEGQHWLPWLKDELEKAGIKTQMPEMPLPYAPDFKTWSAVFEQFPIDQDAILVGHSCGGGFLVRWLSEHKDIKVGKVVLVAPWIDPNHGWAPAMFGGMEIDSQLAERTAGIAEFISLDDDKEELDTLTILKSKIKGLQIVEFTDKGHFTLRDMHTREFPELRDWLLR